MQIINGFDNLPKIMHAVATLGSYDGVHSGHQVLINQVIARAKARGGKSIVLTFEPHPRITLGKAEGLKLLSTIEEKALLLERLGVDYMLIIPFDLEFSHLSHQEFIERYLIEKLGIEELVIGYNHHFGHNKSGDYSYLADKQLLAVTQIEQQRVENDKVSSTVIRTALSNGDIATATRLFGHRYMGFVATNIYKLLPPAGSYIAIVNGATDSVNICNNGVYCSIKSENIIIEL